MLVRKGASFNSGMLVGSLKLELQGICPAYLPRARTTIRQRKTAITQLMETQRRAGLFFLTLATACPDSFADRGLLDFIAN